MFVKREFVTWELQWRIKGSLKLSRWILLTFVPKMFTILLSILWYILYLFTALIKHNSFCAIMLSFYTTYFVQFPSSITVAALSYDCKNLILQKWNIEFNNKKKKRKEKKGMYRMSHSIEQHLMPWILHMKTIKKRVHCPHV